MEMLCTKKAEECLNWIKKTSKIKNGEQVIKDLKKKARCKTMIRENANLIEGYFSSKLLNL